MTEGKGRTDGLIVAHGTFDGLAKQIASFVAAREVLKGSRVAGPALQVYSPFAVEDPMRVSQERKESSHHLPLPIINDFGNRHPRFRWRSSCGAIEPTGGRLGNAPRRLGSSECGA